MIQKITHYYFQFAEHRALRFMPRIVYGFLFVLWLITLPYRNIIWGPDNVLFRYGMADNIIENAILRLYYQPELFPWIYFMYPIFLLLSLRNHPFSFISRILAWFGGLMLFSAAGSVYGSGIIMLLQTALLLTPVHYESASPWRRWLNSFSILSLRLQSIIIVGAIGVFMWGSLQWKAGEAIYYLIHEPFRFRLPFHTMIGESKLILKGINYILLGVISLLPITLIIRPTRFYSTLALLITGIFCTLMYTNMAIGFALITLALPWIDARERYD